jgi:prepilin signal peptidase PulO-like enzyme (type II secretory pathway)
VNFILSIPFELRITTLFILGAGVGAFVNFFVDRMRWNTPRHSPWNQVWERRRDPETQQPGPSRAPSSERKKKKPARKAAKKEKRPAATPWLDFVPILGWFSLSRLSPQKGEKFWVRPLMVELLCAFFFAGLYAWEVGAWRMVPELDPGFNPPPATPPAILAAVVHQQYLAHVLLFTFMLAASLIDLGEWVIPDRITVPGTLTALLLAATVPTSLLSVAILPMPTAMLHLARPFEVPNDLDGGQPIALILALCCVWLWCFAEMPRTWRMRRGLAFAAKLFMLRIARERWTYWIMLIGLLLTALVIGVWWSGGPRWVALLSALVGMGVGSGIVWVVRIVCSAVLRKEAMGFGDVTLMAMIGAFLGWQASVLVFFLSPFFGLIPPLVALLSRSRVQPALPFGPFLCAAAVFVMIAWARVWPWAADVIDAVALLMGHWFFALFVVAGLALMAGLLALIQLAKRAFGWAS